MLIPSRLRAYVIAGTITVIVIGTVWAVVLLSLPRQQAAPDSDPSETQTASSQRLSSAPRQETPRAQGPLGQAPTSEIPGPSTSPSPADPAPVQPNTAAPFPPRSKAKPKHKQPRNVSPSGEESASPDEPMSPQCMAELDQICPASLSGSSRRKCVRESEGKLSSACLQQLSAMAVRIKQDMKNFKAACEGDVRKLCRRIQPGGGTVLQCLEENYQEVSEGCYQVLRVLPLRK